MNRIHQQFERLEQEKETLLQWISSLRPEAYAQQPASDAWSVAQIASHLYLSEQLSLAYLRKKLSFPDTVPPYRVTSWTGIALIKLTFWSSWRVKAPATIDMWKHQPILDAAELSSKWNDLRHEIITFLDLHASQFRSHLVFRHPFAGRLTMRQMLIFMTDHLVHHRKQAERTIKRIREQRT